MPVLKRLLQAILVGTLLALIAGVFLFWGYPTPSSDLCIISEGENRCAGVLFFLPRWVQDVGLLVLVLAYTINSYKDFVKRELKKRQNERDAETIVRIREEAQRRHSGGSDV